MNSNYYYFLLYITMFLFLALNKLVLKLDKRAIRNKIIKHGYKKKQRVLKSPSKLSPPSDAPSWHADTSGWRTPSTSDQRATSMSDKRTPSTSDQHGTSAFSTPDQRTTSVSTPSTSHQRTPSSSHSRSRSRPKKRLDLPAVLESSDTDSEDGSETSSSV
jgi:hypothetical protein